MGRVAIGAGGESYVKGLVGGAGESGEGVMAGRREGREGAAEGVIRSQGAGSPREEAGLVRLGESCPDMHFCFCLCVCITIDERVVRRVCVWLWRTMNYECPDCARTWYVWSSPVLCDGCP